jgi:RNA polymerase sigma-70 factor, ECF subfamily
MTEEPAVAGSDDDVLAMRSRRGDALALATLYARHAAGLLRYLERFKTPVEENEDILQETFIRIFEGRGHYEGRERFRAWLYTVATRLALDHVQEGRRRNDILETRYAPEVGPSIEPQEVALGARMRRRLEAILDALPHEQSLALHLRFQDGFSYREMATICGEAEGTLRSRVHHALRRLREHLDQSERSASRQ